MEMLLFPRFGKILRSEHRSVPQCPDIVGSTVFGDIFRNFKIIAQLAWRHHMNVSNLDIVRLF